MNLKDFEAEIEEALASPTLSKSKKKMLTKMYEKIKGKKMLHIENQADNTNIDKFKKEAEEKVKKLDIGPEEV